MKNILLLAGLLTLAVSADAANVRFAFTNSVGQPDTNWFQVIPIGNVIQSDGSFITRGVPIRITPASNGFATNTFEVGNFSVTNKFIPQGFVIRVPNDHGPTIYDATTPTAYGGLAISGYNTFVTITYGTNPPPTYDEITNSLGYLPQPFGALTNYDTRLPLSIGNGAIVVASNSVIADQNWNFAGDLYGDQIGSWIINQSGSATFLNLTGGGSGLTNLPVAVKAGVGTVISTNGQVYTVDVVGVGTATNVIDIAAGTNIFIETNGLLRTISAGGGVTIPIVVDDEIIITNIYKSAGLSFDTNSGAQFIFSADVAADAFYGDAAGLSNVTATIYVATNGNNETGRRGNSGFPFRNIYNASLIARQGDTISLGRGIFNETNAINVPNNGFLIGFGQQATFITNWNFAASVIPGVLIHPGTNSVISGFTVVDGHRGNSSNILYGAAIGTYEYASQDGFQNALIQNVTILGSSDGFYVQHSNVCSAVLDNVTIDSDWDCIMVKGEPFSSSWVPHSLVIKNCQITGNHGGGWTNRNTYGAAMQATGGRIWIYDTVFRMTNNTFSGSSSAIAAVTGSDVKVWVKDSLLQATSPTSGFSGDEDARYVYLNGVNLPQSHVTTQAALPGSLNIDHGGNQADSLFGINMPPSVTNYGGIPFVGGTNSWSLTASNYGVGGILHRGASLGGGGYPFGISGGVPYWTTVDLTLAREVRGALPTANIDWETVVGGSSIPLVNVGATDVGPLTIGSGLSLVGGTLSATGAGGAATNAIGIISTNNATVYDAVTNLDFWAGSGVAIRATNRSGHVDLNISATGSGDMLESEYATNAVAGIVDTALQLKGFQLPPANTNYGGIPFVIGTNIWSLTASNYGTGRSILHRGSATVSSPNGYGVAGGVPYFDNVLLGPGVNAEVTGFLRTWHIHWDEDDWDPYDILMIDSTGTNITKVTLGTGLTMTTGTLSATGGGGAASGAWNTNGNSSLPNNSFVGTTDSGSLFLRVNNVEIGAFTNSGNVSLGYGHTNTGGGGSMVFGTNNSIIQGEFGVIGGGVGNFITANSSAHKINYATLAGGVNNAISNRGTTTIYGPTIGGGQFNFAQGSYSAMAGGEYNTNTADYATIGGGLNGLVTAEYGSILGGLYNTVSARFATVAGGQFSTASASNSFAAGYRSIASHVGSFVWSDMSDSSAGLTSRGPDSFNIRATNGIWLSGGASFIGNGDLLTNLSASSISSGTIPDARYGGTIELTNSLLPYIGFKDTDNAAYGKITYDGEANTFDFGATAIVANTLSGNGSGLTDLDASSLSSGTVANLRLAGANPTFSGLTITGATPGLIIVTNAASGSYVKIGTNDSVFGTNGALAGMSYTLTNGGATFSSNVVAAKYYGDGSALTGISASGWQMTPLYFYALGNNVAAGTKYMPIGVSIGSFTLQSAALTMSAPSPSGGYLSNLWVRSQVAWPATTNISFTIQTNRGLTTPVDTLVTCTLDPQGGSSSTNSGTTSVALPVQSKTGDAYVWNLKLVITTGTGPTVTPTLSGYVEWWHQ